MTTRETSLPDLDDPEVEEGSEADPESASTGPESASTGPEPASAAPEPEELEAEASAEVEVPRQLLGPVMSVLLEPLFAIIPVVVLVLLALGIGLQKAPVYSAEARAVVGRQDTNANAIPGYAAAVQQLASNYSRLITAQAVTRDLEGTLRLGASVISGHVSASPIPQSPLIRVTATASSRSLAVALANAAISSLVTYVDQTVAGGLQPADLLKRYNNAETNLINAQVDATAAQAAVAKTTNDPVASQQADQAYVNAQAAVATSQLEVTSAATAYNDSINNANAAPITVVSPAATTSSNRKSTVEVYGALALVVGGIVGILLAMFRANRMTLRQLRRRYRLSRPHLT